jgi:tRNA threonylcarbamoyladenosine biosynthesis protein TsaE
MRPPVRPLNVSGLLPTETRSAQETQAVGHALAPLLEMGTTVALQGDLGAGKTEFVKGLVAGLGGEAHRVTSPTFGIVQEYAVSGGFVMHIDAYRTRSEREFFEMGLEESLEGARLVAVEWPDRMGRYLPLDRLVIRLSHKGGNRREISLER